MTHDATISAAALDWVIRQRDPAFADWDAFTAWLEASETHGAAYHEAVLLDDELAGLPAEPVPLVPANDAGEAPAVSRPFGRRAWLSGALAASLVAIIGYANLNRTADSYRVQTAMGETRTISLADGSRISINGGSSVLLSHDAPRTATLEKGQVLFHVVHSDTDPFVVKVGEARLVDLGTVFDVVRAGAQTVVAVSEGAVAYNPDGENLRVDAGKRLTVNEETRDAAIVRVEPAAVGGWEKGQLVYDGVPLDQVAQEVSRTTGVKLRTDKAAGAIRFRGALRTGDNEARMVRDLAALSGTTATQDAGGWTLSK